MNSRDLQGSDPRGAETFLGAVLDGVDQFVIVFDAAGEACWLNATAESALDRPIGEGAAPSFPELVVESDRAEARAAVDRLVETGELAVQLTVAAGDGGLPYEFRGSAVDLPGGERGFVAIGYAIAERRERERKLDALRERTLALMATETKAETAQLAVDAAHTIIGAPLSGIHFPDAAGELLAPVAAVENVGKTFSEEPSYPRDAPAGSRAATVWEVFEGEQPLSIDDVAAYEGIDEGTPTGSVVIHPLGDHGVFIVSAPTADAFDETDRALVDILAGALRAALDRVEREGQLRQQNERLDRFTDIVSHDMRNPLATAQGYLDLARDTGDGDHLDRVEDSLSRMEELVDDLLTLAREGDDSLDRERVVLAELAERSWAGVQTGDAALVVETSATVRGDASRLRQLFENLFRNSVEHGSTSSRPKADDAVEHGTEDPDSALAITVGDLEDVSASRASGGSEDEQSESSGGFYVADDGVGIPADERERVLLSGYSTAEAGTGLGLSIVEEVATAHDWSVTVTESADGGARFEFRGVDTA